MLGLLLPLLFQAAIGEVTITANAPAAQEAPKEVCKTAPVTGSRVVKKRTCKTKESERIADLERDKVKNFLTTNGNAQQPSISGP